MLNSKRQRAIDGRLLHGSFRFNSISIKRQTEIIMFPFVNRIVKGGFGDGTVRLQDKIA